MSLDRTGAFSGTRVDIYINLAQLEHSKKLSLSRMLYSPDTNALLADSYKCSACISFNLDVSFLVQLKHICYFSSFITSISLLELLLNI